MPLERCLFDYFPKSNLLERVVHPPKPVLTWFSSKKCAFRPQRTSNTVSYGNFLKDGPRRLLFCIFVIFGSSKFPSPDEGLEPATLRLKVWCSTDWANRACVKVKPKMSQAVFTSMQEKLLIENIRKGVIMSAFYYNSLLIQLTSWEAFLCHGRHILSWLIISHYYFLVPCPVSSVGRASDF